VNLAAGGGEFTSLLENSVERLFASFPQLEIGKR